MAKKIKPSIFTQNITYFFICLVSLCLIGGSFLLKVNLGEDVTADQKVIEYSYQNESDDPSKRNHFRRVKIQVENAISLLQFETKNMRVCIYRSGELGDKNLQSGKVFSLIMEDMAKFKSVIFDYNRCVVEKADSTDIVIFLFKKYEADLALKTMIININRITDQITVLGKELSAADIWNDNLADAGIINKHQISLDKGYLRLLMEGKADGN